MGILDIFKKQNKGSTPKTAIERKGETEKLLRSFKVPYIDHLPRLEEESETRIRTAQEIAERILVLTYLNYVSEVAGDREKIVEFLKINSLWDKISPEEEQLFLK